MSSSVPLPISLNSSDNRRSVSFIKVTHRQKVRKVVKEIYLRDDIHCGVNNCSTCCIQDGGLHFENEQKLLILDTDVALKQIDFLTCAAINDNVVLLSTVLDEVREKNLHTYSRLRQLCRNVEEAPPRVGTVAATKGDEEHVTKYHVFANEFFSGTYVDRMEDETIRERNRRAIYSAAQWYAKHLSRLGLDVLLVTDSQQHKAKAEECGVVAMTVFEYIKENKSILGDAIEKVSAMEGIEDDGEAMEDGRRLGMKAAVFAAHLTETEIEEGIKERKLFSGPLRMVQESCLQGFVSVKSMEKDVRIKGSLHLNRAIDGDIVAIQLIEDEGVEEAEGLNDDTFMVNEDGELLNDEVLFAPSKSSVKPSEIESPKGSRFNGRVVGILKRVSREYCGTLRPLDKGREAGSSTFVKAERIFIPVDPRIPYIVIKTRYSEQLEGKRIVVVVDSWDRFSRRPLGHWKNILGDIGDKAVENTMILKEHGVVTREFSLEVLRCLPSSEWEASEEEIKKRLDLRETIVCSIDPPGCKDIDDTLSLEALPNGNYRVGIHIADVTHFVKSGTPIDREAAERSTSVYLVDRRTDMLPSLLTTDLCSLVSGKDRLAFSALVELTKDAEIVEAKFHKTIIRSAASLTYAAAQFIIDDTSDNSQLAINLRLLNSLARKLRQRRFKKGALELASMEVQFELDSETQDPTKMDIYRLRETNKLVEEFMLLANCCVAEYILKWYPLYSVLRRHPSPKNDELHDLQDRLIECNFNEFKYGDSKELAASLETIGREGDPLFNKIIRILTTRCMNQAVYFCTGNTSTSLYHHYGLAADLYTHFTSPIRRYADVMVHRLLAAALQIEALPIEMQRISQIADQCEVMNLKHRNAQLSSRASIRLNTYLHFKKLGTCEAVAVILSTRRNGLKVFVPKFALEGLVKMDKQTTSYDEKKCTMQVTEGSKVTVLAVFDYITIKIECNDKQFRYQLEIKYVGKHEDEHKSKLNSEVTQQYPENAIESTINSY